MKKEQKMGGASTKNNHIEFCSQSVIDSAVSQKKHVFYSLAFCYTRMFNRHILRKCYVILLRIAIANIWG